MRKIILIVSALFLAAVLGIISYALFFTTTEAKLTSPLESIVPATLDGWTITDLPLAETEGMRQYVGNLLQFDQYVSKTFRKGDLEIIVYVAYWEPGGKSPFDAGGHNPDSCWIESGWLRSAREYSTSGKQIGGQELVPFEYGVYLKNDSTLPVIFWHLVNGTPFNYQTQLGWREGIEGAIERTSIRIEDFKRLGLNQRREQMFIRISFPNQDMGKVWENPDFHELLLSLDRLGIFKDQPWR